MTPDGEGNRTASHLSSLYASNAHNQLLEDARYTYAYDARGNRTSRTDKATGAVETYSYDSQNRLIGYASPTTTAAYAYNALDRRFAKVVDARHFDPAIGQFLQRDPIGFLRDYVVEIRGNGQRRWPDEVKALKVGRFQNAGDRTFKRTNAAVAILNDDIFKEMVDHFSGGTS